MNEHLKKSETELNELLAEYWKLRRETGIFPSLPLVQCIDNLEPDHRYIHGDSGQQVGHASHLRVIQVYIMCVLIRHLQCGTLLGVTCIDFSPSITLEFVSSTILAKPFPSRRFC